MAIPNLANSIVEHVYNPQAQFQPRRRNHPQGGDTLAVPGMRGQKVWTEQGSHMYTKDPKIFQEESILMKIRPGQDARERVHNTTDPLYCLHAQITVEVQNDVYVGSGALVGPHHLLTCAHNVFKHKYKMWVTDISVYPALNGKQAPFGKIKVIKVYTFSQYIQNQDSDYDLALLILEKSIGKYTGWAGLLSAPDQTLSQQEVNIHGYPGDKGFTKMWGMKHTIQRIYPEQFEYLIDTNGGQSGSAIWINQFGLPMIVGVHIAGGDNANFGVRLSKDKFQVLISKIEETYKVLVSPQPALPPIAFGKAKWAQYFGDIGVEPPLPPNIHEILNAPCPFWPGKRVHETHLLTLIPRSVNGKPFTLNSLSELIQRPQGGGKVTKYSNYWDGIQKEYGNAAPNASYWALLTKNVIPDSRSKKYNTQKQLLATYSQKSKLPYEVPLLLESATSILMEHVQSGTRLYSDNPYTYTNCQERVAAYPHYPLVVGGFAAGGLLVDCYFYDFGFEYFGLGGCRKF